MSYEINQFKVSRLHLSTKDAISLVNYSEGLFLDVRKSSCYKKGRIVGSINRDSAETKNSARQLSRHKDSIIIIYCSTGSQSYSVYKKLKRDGFSKLYILKGGFDQWLRDKLPISTS